MWGTQKNPGTQKKFKPMNLLVKITEKQPPAVWRPSGRTHRNKYSDPLITIPTQLLPFFRKTYIRERRRMRFFQIINILVGIQPEKSLDSGLGREIFLKITLFDSINGPKIELKSAIGPWARWQIFPENDKIFLGKLKFKIKNHKITTKTEFLGPAHKLFGKKNLEQFWSKFAPPEFPLIKYRKKRVFLN